MPTVGYQLAPLASYQVPPSAPDTLPDGGDINSLDEDVMDVNDDLVRHGDSHHITWGRANTKDAYFDDMTPTNVTAVVGQTARLPCRVVNLGQKDVS